MTKVIKVILSKCHLYRTIVICMKTIHKKVLPFLVCTLFLLACHPTHFVVGKGAQEKQVVTQRNNFLFLGLVHVGEAPDPKTMSNQSPNYTITVKLTFTDVMLNVISLGFYSPLTVQVAY